MLLVQPSSLLLIQYRRRFLLSRELERAAGSLTSLNQGDTFGIVYDNSQASEMGFFPATATYSSSTTNVNLTPLQSNGTNFIPGLNVISSCSNTLEHSSRSNFVSSTDGIFAGNEDMMQKAMRSAAIRC